MGIFIRCVIYAGKFLMIFFVSAVLCISADEYPQEVEGLVYNYERKEGDKYYFKRAKYKLISELEGRCIFGIVDEVSVPSFVSEGEQDYIVEEFYAVTKKRGGRCEFDNNVFRNESVIFFRMNLVEFLAVEPEFYSFLNSSYLRNYILSELGYSAYSAFSIAKVGDFDFRVNLSIGGSVYNMSVLFANENIKILKVNKEFENLNY